MKQIILLITLFCSSAFADTTSTPLPTTGPWTLVRGNTGAVGWNFGSAASCYAAAPSNAEALKSSSTYVCRQDLKFLVSYTKPVNPFPNGETQIVPCVAPDTGSWPQTRTYSLVSGKWAPDAWIPSMAPSGACTPSVVTPPPPPVTGSFMPYIDPAKIPTVNLAGYSTLRIQPVSSDPNLQPVAHGELEGDFREPCEVAKFAYVDPLLFPGQATAGHLHVFWGNTGITGNSNSDSIANTGNSTCAGGLANRTGYWMPAMIDTLDGTTLMPVGVQTYYKSGPHAGRDVKELPPGLRMIAGNPAAKSAADIIPWSMRYTCATNNTGNTSTIPTDCPAGGQIWAIVVFPSCWDGVNLDSPNHRSHMSMAVSDPTTPTGQGCPSTHPVKLPEISTIAEYVVPTAGASARWRLASDNYDPATGAGGLSLHSDWWNGWQPAVVKTWTANCLNKELDCHSYLLGDGNMLY